MRNLQGRLDRHIAMWPPILVWLVVMPILSVLLIYQLLTLPLALAGMLIRLALELMTGRPILSLNERRVLAVVRAGGTLAQAAEAVGVSPDALCRSWRALQDPRHPLRSDPHFQAAYEAWQASNTTGP